MFQKYQIVESVMGRDKQRLMAVVDTDEKFIYVCDGKYHPLDNPKRKNPRHLRKIGVNITESQLVSDRALRKALAASRS